VGGLCGLPGCSTDSAIEVRSVETPAVDRPILPTCAYWASDNNTADIFLTDLDPAELDRGTDLSKVSGRITQIHVFIAPLAGSTPIASSACSTTVRHIVLAEGAIGVYSGGGFFLPKERLGATELAGSISGVTLRLSGRTPTFADRLGPCELRGKIVAPRDEALAKRIGARVDDVLLVVRPVEKR
jgi:hypothetical protein